MRPSHLLLLEYVQWETFNSSELVFLNDSEPYAWPSPHWALAATGSILDPRNIARSEGRHAQARLGAGHNLSAHPVLCVALALRADEHEGETVTEYAKRWCEWREGSGLACVGDDRARLLCHVLPVIGTRGIVDVTRDDLKRLVSMLDAKARRGFREGTDGRRKSFGWKSAVHAWTVVRAMFPDACGAKRVDLCVRDDNPAAGVAAPDTGTRKAKTYLWPSEFLALVSSPSVPVRWRRLVALAVCTYARAGELAALEWDGIDLEHGTIHVNRSKGSKGKRSLKPTKTDVARRIPIEPSLMPLLRAMHAEAKGRGDAPRGALVCMPASGQLSAKLKVSAGLLARGPVRPTPKRRPEVLASVSAFGVAGSTKHGKTRVIRSGRRDLNPRRRAPKARALPDCATPRRTMDL
jgi:integrase